MHGTECGQIAQSNDTVRRLMLDSRQAHDTGSLIVPVLVLPEVLSWVVPTSPTPSSTLPPIAPCTQYSERIYSADFPHRPVLSNRGCSPWTRCGFKYDQKQKL